MADLTPNNREEYWLKGMVDGQTTLEPNKRREFWYKEIVDAIGSGGGGGTGGGVLAVVVDRQTMALDKTWQEIYDAYNAHKVVMLYFDNVVVYLTLISPKGGSNIQYRVTFFNSSDSLKFVCDNATDYPVYSEK